VFRVADAQSSPPTIARSRNRSSPAPRVGWANNCSIGQLVLVIVEHLLLARCRPAWALSPPASGAMRFGRLVRPGGAIAPFRCLADGRVAPSVTVPPAAPRGTPGAVCRPMFRPRRCPSGRRSMPPRPAMSRRARAPPTARARPRSAARLPRGVGSALRTTRSAWAPLPGPSRSRADGVPDDAPGQAEVAWRYSPTERKPGVLQWSYSRLTGA
jgi:hypothetical protein